MFLVDWVKKVEAALKKAGRDARNYRITHIDVSDPANAEFEFDHELQTVRITSPAPVVDFFNTDEEVSFF